MSRKTRKTWRIREVSERYGIHPQTLRLYEREGLLRPSRSRGNARSYSDEDLRRLEVVLTLTRDLGVNLAGIEVILNMRDRMAELQAEVTRLGEALTEALTARDPGGTRALVRVPAARVMRAQPRGH